MRIILDNPMVECYNSYNSCYRSPCSVPIPASGTGGVSGKTVTVGNPSFVRYLGKHRIPGGTTVTQAQETPTPVVISATTLRTKTRDILEQAKFQGQHFIVETFGKPMVAIVGVDEYWGLVNHKSQHNTPTPGE